MLDTLIQGMEGEPVDAGDPNEMGIEEKALMKIGNSLKLLEATGNREIPAGVIFYNNRVLLPQAIWHRVIAGCHCTGHLGIGKTYD